MPVRELVVDGVRVFHLPGPSKTRATLSFGVGLRDETFETVGITHLVEHLAMAQLPKSHLDANATVGVGYTAFYAEGRPAEVGDFLRRVCTALADLPLDHLDREKAVLEAEAGVGAHLSMAAAWAARYGFDGPGLTTTPGRGPMGISGEEVLAHVVEHFTAARAVLAVLGPLPEGLRLPLLAGTSPAPVHRTPLPRLGDGPEWVPASPSPGVALLLDGLEPDDDVTRLAGSVLCERLEDAARDQLGVAVSLAFDLMEGPDGDVLTIAVDHDDDAASAVAGLVWEQLVDLAANGPTQAELDHMRGWYATTVDTDDEEVVEEEPFRRASHVVMRTTTSHPARSLAETAAALAAATREDVRDRLAAAVRRALLVVPEDTRLPDEALRAAPIPERAWCAHGRELPPGRVVRPTLRHRLSRHGGFRSLVLSDERLAWEDEDGDVHGMRWDDVVLAVERDDASAVVVIGRHLCNVELRRSTFGREAFDEVLRHLAPHLERSRAREAVAERSASG